ncbi:hypothetical protein AAMO2058_000251800 [Amorphochlora amoebiformis]
MAARMRSFFHATNPHTRRRRKTLAAIAGMIILGCVQQLSKRLSTSSTGVSPKVFAEKANGNGAYSYFGKFRINNREQVFFASKHSLGIVNLKPIVPGHVLVIPKEVKPRISDLTREEVQDLFESVTIIGPKIESHYKGTALNIAIQDGKDAGQSVAHVHVHILPRRPKDIEPNDKVYDEIENWDGEKAIPSPKNTKLEVPADEDRRPRSSEEMSKEASELRKLFPDNQPEL